MPKITLEYYGVEGAGRTVKDARADAGRKIQAMLAGSYTPHVVSYRAYAVLVFREPTSGWATMIIADEDGVRFSEGGSCHGYEDQFEAMKAARMHVAQLGWAKADGLAAPALLPEREGAEFISWARFQLKYSELKASGLTETECHQQACNAMYV